MRMPVLSRQVDCPGKRPFSREFIAPRQFHVHRSSHQSQTFVLILIHASIAGSIDNDRLKKSANK